MTTKDSRDLYWRFRQASGMPYNKNTWRVYLKFLGIDGEPMHIAYHSGKIVNKASVVVELSEDTKHKMEWLGGPHYKALYAAWRARNDQG